MFTGHRPLSQLEKKPKKNLPSPVFLGLLLSVIFYFSSFARHVIKSQGLFLMRRRSYGIKMEIIANTANNI